MDIPPRTVTFKVMQTAFKQLNDLSLAEYNASLQDVLHDQSRNPEDRLWRIGRLAGITVKQPFAEPVEITKEQSRTGARYGWILKSESLSNPRPEWWQYQLLESLVQDPSIGDPRMVDFYRPLDTLTEKVAFALEQMHTERGLFRCMVMSARNYLCGNKQLQAAVDEAAKATPQENRGLLTPQGAIGAGSVEVGHLVTESVPWLSPSAATVTTVIVLIIGVIGLDGFCAWSSVYADQKIYEGNPES